MYKCASVANFPLKHFIQPIELCKWIFGKLCDVSVFITSMQTLKEVFFQYLDVDSRASGENKTTFSRKMS